MLQTKQNMSFGHNSAVIDISVSPNDELHQVNVDLKGIIFLLGEYFHCPVSTGKALPTKTADTPLDTHGAGVEVPGKPKPFGGNKRTLYTVATGRCSI
jgi:hypothetical protein